MIRQIIRVDSEEYTIHIPREYLNKKIEILVFPLEMEAPEVPGEEIINSIRDSSGLLKNRDIDPVAWQRSIRSEW
jgi:hypothetical protein